MINLQRWLAIRVAPGPGVLSLYESHAPYRQMDKSAGDRPLVVLAIGSTQKQLFLEQHFSVRSDQIGSSAVRFVSLHGRMCLFDCELHDLQSPLAMSTPGAGTLHELRRSVQSPSQIARALCCEVLCPFADVVLLFDSDFGGISSISEFLIYWVNISIEKPRISKPFIIIVSSEKFDADQLSSLVAAGLRGKVGRASESSPVDFDAAIHYCCTLQVIDGSLDAPTITTSLLHISEAASARRQENGLQFTAGHLKALLRLAVRDFARFENAIFDPYVAARACNPIPSTTRGCLRDFFRESTVVGTSLAHLVASALVMNAYPPGMHYFHPDEAFVACYENIFEGEGRHGLAGELESVRNSFIRLAREHWIHSSTSAELHAQILRHSRTGDQIITGACAFCFIQLPRYSLSCKHRLCRPCVINRGEEVDLWTFRVACCPWCMKLNNLTFVLKPPTAGSRLLKLGGSDYIQTWTFLQTLHRTLGITAMRLPDYFDGVIAAKKGSLFAIMVFMEGWSLAECKYHLLKAKPPKFLRRRRVTFGKGLEWDLDDAKMFRRMDVILENERFFWSNFISPRHDVQQSTSSGPSDPRSSHAGTRTSEYETTWTPYRADAIFQFDGGPLDQIPLMAGRLYSCLFYVELLETPLFYTTPQQCFVKINCRLPPGPSLVDFLSKLQRKNACFQYRGSELQYTEATVCTSEILEKCKSGSPYSRKLDLEVESINSQLDFQLDGIGSGLHRLSNCPYRLGQLIHDQGWACPFGRADHVETTENSKTSSSLAIALERLDARLNIVRWTI